MSGTSGRHTKTETLKLSTINAIFFDGRISCSDNIEIEIDMLDEIDNSYESEYDKHEPRLLLCDSCNKEFQIPGYPVH